MPNLTPSGLSSGKIPYTMLCPPSKKMDHTVELNPFRQYRGEYGREIKPVPGETYLYVTSPAGPGASISLDFDKLLFESLTKRGRAIKHNRTHATAWKKYASYIPTKQDHAGLEKYITRQTEKTSTDSIHLAMTNPFFCTTIISIQTMKRAVR